MKKRIDVLSKELILLAIRVNELKATKRHLSNILINVGNKLKKYDNANTFKKASTGLIVEIDIEIARRYKRMKRIATSLFKSSGKIFQEDPKDIRPSTREILDGYIELNEIKEDTLIPNILILNTGQILNRDSYEAYALLHESYLNEREFNKLLSYFILLDELGFYGKYNSYKIKKDKDGKAKAILTEDHKTNLLTKNDI